MATLTIQGSGSSDTYIESVGTTTNYATDTDFPVGEWDGATKVHRELLWFDLSTIPAGSTINSATLTLTTKDTAGGTANNRTLDVFRTKRTWVVNQATWAVYSTGNSWTTAGCGSTTDDYESTSVGTLAMVDGEATNTARDITLDTALVATMIPGGAYDGKGFLLKMQTETNDAFVFHSADTTTASYRPKLVVAYTTATGSSGFFNFM